MNHTETFDFETNVDSIIRLLRAVQCDPVINQKVMTILQMDSYKRRLILNNWLEELRCKNASGKLTQTFSLLFDDNIARRILKFISKP